jgi:hypothetical protein
MNYTKNTWKSGDTVTSAKLNNMEEGIAAASGGGGALVVNLSIDGDDKFVMDKTWKEIRDAMATQVVVADFYVEEGQDLNRHLVVETAYAQGTYAVAIFSFSTQVKIILTTDNENGYPVG